MSRGKGQMRSGAKRKRDTDAHPQQQSTKELILKAAVDEFAEHGLAGGRVDRIKLRAGVNKQAIYYHFKNKDALFSAALAYCYTQFKVEVDDWSDKVSSKDALRRIVEAIFLNVQNNNSAAALLIDENRNKGRHLKANVRSTVKDTTSRTISVVRQVIAAGQREGIFRSDVDPDQVYLDIISLSFFIFDHRHTMREVFGAEQTTPERLAIRKYHIVETIVRAVCAD
jgi:AcrR family transcriptional regulator